MSTLESDISAEVGASLIRTPANLPRPHWLKEGTFDSRSWLVIDNLLASPKPAKRIRWDVQVYDPQRPSEVCRLTDSKYSPLLDTIKRQSYGLRVGKYATVTTAFTHSTMTQRKVHWVLWMIQNSIYRFSDLGPDDFDSYAEAARYGPGFLLSFALRLRNYVKEVEQARGELPSKKPAHMRGCVLNSFQLLEDAGIDTLMGRVDHATAYELAKISVERGFYIQPRQIKRLARETPAIKPLSSLQFLETLQPWDYQWRMRHQLPGDRVQFNPFDNISPTRMAFQLSGGQPTRTKTAPIKQTMELIDLSIRWMLYYSSPLLDLRDQHFEDDDPSLSTQQRLKSLSLAISTVHIPDGPGRPYPLKANTKKTTGNDRLEFGIAVNRFLPIACAIVICAFTARRHNEVLTIRGTGSQHEGCISHDENGYWIETFIEKSCQDWIKTPCNELVAEAVRVLERWSSSARSLSGKDGLFQVRRLGSNEVEKFYLNDALKDFVIFLNLTPMPDGSQWEFVPHQFRRFFAIMYFWHYHYRDLGALSYHFRHSDLEMTLKYVTEYDAGAIFRQVGKEHTATLLTQTALGERNLSGPFGERFKDTAMKLYRRYKSLTKVVSEKLVSKVIERYVNKSGRRLRAMPWGYCACRNTRQELNTARCLKNNGLKNSGGPDFGRSSPAVCCDCPHHATEKVFEPFLLSQIEFHERAAADTNNGRLVRITSREHVRKIRAHYHRAFQDSRPVEAPNG